MVYYIFTFIHFYIFQLLGSLVKDCFGKVAIKLLSYCLWLSFKKSNLLRFHQQKKSYYQITKFSYSLLLVFVIKIDQKLYQNKEYLQITLNKYVPLIIIRKD